ncbi:MAG: hypothetical protein WA908_03930, partial [Pontixanthobacter sp.]
VSFGASGGAGRSVVTHLRSLTFGVMICAISTAPAMGQDEPPNKSPPDKPQSEPVDQPTIVVTGEVEEDRPQVLLGSRIAKRPFVQYAGIATNTGTRDLTPGSGMDQGASVRITRTSTCTSDDPLIGRKAACLMIEADTAYAKGNVGAAQDTLASLTSDTRFTPHERLAGAKRQYAFAQSEGNDASREVALSGMVATRAMTLEREIQARRTLVSMAFGDGRRAVARERMMQLDAIAPLDADQLATLAILTREQNAGDASDIMRRAIAASEAAGRSVPKS